ncbi:hypothetical protein KR222_003330, partial [Zaprionus bogoriensis]
KFDCISGSAPGASVASDASPSVCGSRDLNTYVDSIVKRKLGTLLDDVYNLKKQLTSASCNSHGGVPAPKSEQMTVVAKTRINYASDDLGARINHVLAQPIGGTNILKSLIGLDFSGNPPINMLRPSMTPGACFGFTGSKATVSVRLAQTIIVEEITLTHISKEMTPKLCVDNAPKDFEVYGLVPSSSKKECLGQWAYENAPKKLTQRYRVTNEGEFRNLILTFNTNHGANTTCIYR